MKAIKQLLLDGYEIKKNGVEIYDLRQFTNEGRKFDKRMNIQVYNKKERNEEEQCRNFYNIDDAIETFLELV